jgi:hypothetical protein
MECKEDYRRVMATCVRKVYDNDKKYYTPWPEAPWMLRPYNKSTLALIYVFIVSYHKSSEIDKLKKQGVVRYQICFNTVANFL